MPFRNYLCLDIYISDSVCSRRLATSTAVPANTAGWSAWTIGVTVCLVAAATVLAGTLVLALLCHMNQTQSYYPQPCDYPEL